jgi:hypothetical protein
MKRHGLPTQDRQLHRCVSSRAMVYNSALRFSSRTTEDRLAESVDC